MSSASIPGTEPERASRSARMVMLRETRECASQMGWKRSMKFRLRPGGRARGPSAWHRRKFVGGPRNQGDRKTKNPTKPCGFMGLGGMKKVRKGSVVVDEISVALVSATLTQRTCIDKEACRVTIVLGRERIVVDPELRP